MSAPFSDEFGGTDGDIVLLGIDDDRYVFKSVLPHGLDLSVLVMYPEGGCLRNSSFP